MHRWTWAYLFFLLFEVINFTIERLQKNLCKRVYYSVNVYLNKNHMSETKQNYDGKPSHSALRSITDRVHWVTVLTQLNLVFT